MLNSKEKSYSFPTTKRNKIVNLLQVLRDPRKRGFFWTLTPPPSLGRGKKKIGEEEEEFLDLSSSTLIVT